ncbi:MAG TPA: peptidoglycan bridge formation glycyltransferase FemA/FemB family protein [Oscillospiraceae bacterium]|nr:peptidoglycan bridge formation glycyltransferase FemA/FemB family protein [Oscillospiraceae bacterium]HPS34042.1 peptidoglycan bridge formation glycyltransferase FemA/FemB family protein [Oscillospiraceae bacterium]
MTDREIENFIRTSPKGHFCQSEKWAAVKRDWTRKTVAVTDPNGQIKGAISFLLRKTPVLPYHLMYAPRGPVCDPDDAGTLKALIEKSKELAKKCHGYIIKLDPDVPVQNTGFIKILEDEGFSRVVGKNFDAVQPNFVFRLDIKGKTEEEVFAGFAAKTRYNIRVAEKNGVKVRVGGLPDLGEFARIMKITGERDGFATRPEYYFKGLLTAMSENARLYVAELDGKMIAATIPIQYGNKTWYLYGASDNEYRNAMPNYLLQWEMIRWAVQSGCEIYDFRGVSGDLSPENPLYGLYRFKKGFGGELTEFCGEFNLVTNPGVEKLVHRGIELIKNIRR